MFQFFKVKPLFVLVIAKNLFFYELKQKVTCHKVFKSKYKFKMIYFNG